MDDSTQDKYQTYVDDIKGMIGISDGDFDTLRQHKGFILDHAEVLIGFIMNTINEHPPARKVFDEKRGDQGCLGASVGKWLGEVLDAGDTDAFWRRHYQIGLEHIKRQIPNRHMISLATRIRELLLPVMLEKLGTEDGLTLYLAFQRFLDTVVALTITLVDEGQRRCIQESTGFSVDLLNRLQAGVFHTIEEELKR
ncbi:protoglobin domain-containing protein [Pseudomonadota bacterium]